MWTERSGRWVAETEPGVWDNLYSEAELGRRPVPGGKSGYTGAGSIRPESLDLADGESEQKKDQVNREGD